MLKSMPSSLAPTNIRYKLASKQTSNTPLIIAQPTFEDVTDYQDTMPFEVEAIPLTADLQHDIGRMREASMNRPSLVYFCNPNNPTGTITSSRDIDAWIADVDPMEML